MSRNARSEAGLGEALRRVRSEGGAEGTGRDGREPTPHGGSSWRILGLADASPRIVPGFAVADREQSSA